MAEGAKKGNHVVVGWDDGIEQSFLDIDCIQYKPVLDMMQRPSDGLLIVNPTKFKFIRTWTYNKEEE